MKRLGAGDLGVQARHGYDGDIKLNVVLMSWLTKNKESRECRI